jgi:hypothetical protein
MEGLLHVRLQRHDRHRLRHPVNHARNAENPRPALLRYFHRADRTGKITTRGHAIPQLVEVILQPLLELRNRHPIGPGRSSILFHFQPRTPHQTLRDVMRLDLRPRFTHAIPPFRLITFAYQDSPAPWLRPHCDTQGHHSYYGRVRQRDPRRYSAPYGFAAWSPPSRRLFRRQYRITPSHVPYESLVRAHAAYMPETAWAVDGYPPGLSRSSFATPVSISSDFISTRQRQRAYAHRSSSRTSPDAVEPRLFPRRSPQRSSANAARGGLEPLPAERLWRTNKPPSLAQHRVQ